jgi:hypothetical protein
MEQRPEPAFRDRADAEGRTAPRHILERLAAARAASHSGAGG